MKIFIFFLHLCLFVHGSNASGFAEQGIYVRVPSADNSEISAEQFPTRDLKVEDLGVDLEDNMVGGIQFFPLSRSINLGMTAAAEEYQSCIMTCGISTDGNCSIPDWLKHITSGVDVTKVDLQPIRSTNDMQGIKSPLFEFDCSSGTLFQYGKDTYDMPREISHITKSPSENYDMTSRMMADLKSINEAKKLRFGVEGSFFQKSFAMTNSHSEFKFRESIAAHDNVIIDSVYPVSMMKIRANYDFMFDEHPKSLVREFISSKLKNKTYIEKPRDYLRFVSTVGTHVIEEADFGGVLRFSTEIKDKLKAGFTKSELEQQSKASTKVFLMTKGAKVSEITPESREFSDLSSKSITCFGGTMTDITSREWSLEQWQASVENKPHLIGAKLSPISNFIQDERASEGVRTASCILIALNALEVILEEIRLKTLRIPKQQAEVLSPFEDLKAKAQAYVEKLSDIGAIVHHAALCHAVLDVFSQEAEDLLESISNGQDEKVQAPGLPNELNGPLDTQCPKGYIIDSISSEWSKVDSDRKWTATCRKSFFKLSNQCTTYGPFTKLETITFSCPKNGALTGMKSVFESESEDRLWSLTCCSMGDSCKNKQISCSWTQPTYIRQAKTSMEIPIGNFVRSVRSFPYTWEKTSGFWKVARRNLYSDRVWEYEFCLIKKCN